MIKNLCWYSIFIFFSCQFLHGQIQEVNWSAALGGSLYEQSNRLSIGNDGSVLVVGYFQDSLLGVSAGGFEDGLLVKYNAQGQRQWVHSFHSTDVDRIYSVATDVSGNIYVCGEFKGQISSLSDTLTSIDQLDAYVAKLDPNGQSLWMKRIGGFDFDSATDVIVSPSGYVYVGGYFEQDLSIGSLSIVSNGLRDGFVVKLDSNGQEHWMDHIGGSGFDEIVSLSMNANDSLVVGGNFRDAINYQGNTYFGWGNYDMFIAKFAPSGQLSCIQVFGGFGSDYLKDIQVDSVGDVYITGWYSNEMFINGNAIFGKMEEDGFLLKLNSNCSYGWCYSLGGDFDERGIALSVSSTNDIYLTGTVDSLLVIEGDTLTNRHFNRPTNVMVASFTSSGQYRWSTSFGAPFIDFPTDIQLLGDQMVITGGFYDFFNYQNDSLFAVGQYDIFTYSFKLDTFLSVKHLPKEDVSFGVYPNPFDDHFSICFHPSKTCKKVVVSTLNGQIIHSFDMNSLSANTKFRIPFKLASEHFYIVTLIDDDHRTYSQLLKYEGR